MKSEPESPRWPRALRLRCLVLLVAWALVHGAPWARAQKADKQTAEETFEKIDPYTGGTREGLDKAGYVSFGPFPWCEGVTAADVELVVGRPVLWLETEHFKIGSTLESYKRTGDKREDKKLALELERLTLKLVKSPVSKSKVDPWLRLHLYAQRLEDLYAEFEQRFQVDDRDFAGRNGVMPPNMGVGPYLGQSLKFTVLLAEKQSHLGRFARRYLGREVHAAIRERLPGASLFLGVGAEALDEYDFNLDAALHCLVASEITFNLIDGFRNSFAAPFWFKQGLAHAASRRVDERWTFFAAGTMRDKKDDSWRWEPRLYGLVSNGFVPKWSAMAAWRRWEDLDPQGHMTAWSRAEWLLDRRDLDRKALLMALTEPLPQVSAEERARLVEARQVETLKKVCGRDMGELDDSWRQFVLKSYPKK